MFRLSIFVTHQFAKSSSLVDQISNRHRVLRNSNVGEICFTPGYRMIFKQATQVYCNFLMHK